MSETPLLESPESRLRRARSLGAMVALVGVVAIASADYQVQQGDTLAGIANAHGTTVQALAEANGIADPDLIRVGQVLSIPGESGGGTHVVAPGDTLARIAAERGTTVAALIEANGIPNPNLIRPGQELQIPGSAPGGTGPGSPAPTSETGSTTHVVQPGESLAAIAAKYGTTAEAIASANGITNPSVIYAGTSLVIGGSPAAVLTGGGQATHSVAPGETLASIASRYGTSIDALAASNGLTNPNLIRVGEELTVPSAAWICPVEGARYFNDWGFPRSGGRFHQGNDLYAPRGTPVRAPVSGHVELKTGTVGGLQFWLTGDDGNLYIGTHMEAFGQAGRVQAGDVVGRVGDTGNALGSEPHLHFEVHVDGTPVNPYPTLQANGC